MELINRKQAGILLAERLQSIPLKEPIILALPRGGVPVAFEISKQMGAPLDVLVVRKVGAPGYEEFGIGAVTENNHYWIDPEAMRQFGSSAIEIDHTLTSEKKEVARRIRLYRENRPLPRISNRSVLVVDDGLATGVTARVACAYLKQQGAAEVILAVPVCSPRTASIVRGEVDQLVCLDEPDSFFSVGQFYQHFPQISDDEVIRTLRLARIEEEQTLDSRDLNIKEGEISLRGTLSLPKDAKGIVVFAHGSGSSRFSPRNQQVARALNAAGLATLLFDLLTEEEAGERRNVFDISLLGNRLSMAVRWLRLQGHHLPIGLFGASTGGGAAIWAAAEIGNEIAAVVSRGGRPDLAGDRLKDNLSPTLLLVGGRDEPVIHLNRRALSQMKNAKLKIIPGATHLFEEAGTMEKVEETATEWFLQNFSGRRRAVA